MARRSRAVVLLAISMVIASAAPALARVRVERADNLSGVRVVSDGPIFPANWVVLNTPQHSGQEVIDLNAEVGSGVPTPPRGVPAYDDAIPGGLPGGARP
jgi:hypothetical protein